MGDTDRLGGLPDDIISHILSFISTKEAIRTSVLSSSWRYRFASMSTFDFVEDCFARGEMGTHNNFKIVVDRLLSFPNPLTVDCFRLYSWDADESLVYRWISVVLSRGVKELDLCRSVSPILASHMFSSHSLVTLKLDPSGVIHIPTNVSLPNLKILHLNRFRVLDDSLFRFISSCNVLQELELTAPYQLDLRDIIIKNPSLKRLVLNVGVREFIHLVEINAPNLVYFYYVDDNSVDRYVLSDMKSLERAYIKISAYEGRDPPSFLEAICNVQSLNINVAALSQTVFAFNNLVELELDCGEWLVEFLHRTPNLKTLILLDVAGDVFRFIPENVPSCLSFHLKKITFYADFTYELMLEAISYFLNHVLVLEKLRIRFLIAYPKGDSSLSKKLWRLLGISIDKLLDSEEDYGTVKKILMLPGSRTIDVSVVKWTYHASQINVA